jgi:hypothetical protein
VAEALEMLSPLEGRVAIWRESTDQFLIVVAEGERIGSVRAKDLNHLLRTIEELFDTHLLPPANPTFDIIVAPPDNKTIHDHAKKLLLATAAALEAAVRP